MDDTATARIIASPSPIEVVVHSSSRTAKREQSQRQSRPPTPASHHAPAAAAACINQPAINLNVDQVMAAEGRLGSRGNT
jgi:hypothetical protein